MKEQNSFVFQHQATLYFDATRAAATIATGIAEGTGVGDQKTISEKTLQDARERFAQLYYGEMAAVEDRRVELAMISFQSCLLLKGIACKRERVNQYGDPNDHEIDTEPALQNLALEIGACTRTALEQGRGIQLGLVKPAITRCPYD